MIMHGKYYRITENFRGSLKIWIFAEKLLCVTLPSIYKHRAIILTQNVHGEYFTNDRLSAEFEKVFSHENFPLYGILRWHTLKKLHL